MLCAPLIIEHVGDLRGREAHFKCHAASVRLHTVDKDVMAALFQIISDMPGGGLSVTVVLEESVTSLPHGFMRDWAAMGRLDLGRTSLQSIGSSCLNHCGNLTTVTFPPSLTALGPLFLWGCHALQNVESR